MKSINVQMTDIYLDLYQTLYRGTYPDIYLARYISVSVYKVGTVQYIYLARYISGYVPNIVPHIAVMFQIYIWHCMVKAAIKMNNNEIERERYNGMSKKKKEKRLMQMREYATAYYNNKKAMESNLKQRIDELEENESDFVQRINKFPLHLLPSARCHDITCPRSPFFNTQSTTARGGRVVLSFLFSLKQKTPIYLFPGTHLSKSELINMTRVNRFHSMLFEKIVLQEGEGIVFDMNLVHAGGDNEEANPRIFATFSENYIALENRNYINDCTICAEDVEYCTACETIGRIMNEENRDAPLIGLDHPIHRYSCFSLQDFGFCIIKPNTKAPANLGEFLKNLSDWNPLKGFKFKSIGQDLVRGEDAKKRNILDIGEKSNAQDLIKENKPELDEYMKGVFAEVESLVEYELGKVFKLNDYTILMNGKEGANKQTPHMDAKMICNCL